MYNNSFECYKCGYNNPPNVKACQNCRTYIGNKVDRQSDFSTNSSKTNSYWKFAFLLIIPAFFVVKWFYSYGQTSVKKADRMDTAQNFSNPNKNNIEIPDRAWFNQSFKSSVSDMPSVEDVLAKEIEVSGGWKSLQPLETVEYTANSYEMDCRLNPDVMPNTDPGFEITFKYKQPNKLFRQNYYRDSGQTSRIFSNGQTAYSVDFIREDEKVFEPVTNPAFGDYQGLLVSTAEDWAENFENFSEISVEKVEPYVAYAISARRKKPLSKNSLGGNDKFFFDVVTGRLIAVYSNQSKAFFSDFRQVKNMHLPHKICVENNGSSHFMLSINQWKLNEPMSDSVFEKPMF